MDVRKLFGQKLFGPKGKSEDDEAEINKAKTSPRREKYGLFDLYSPPAEEIEVDVVAVHGLNGDWEMTWTETTTGNMWLRDFVPIQCPKFRVMSFGYDSTFALSHSEATIDDAAHDLINRLDDERQSSPAKKRPLIFVAHSLGGVVVKRALMIANERSAHWGHLRDQAKYAIPIPGANHINICKFDSSDAQKYKPVKGALAKISELVGMPEASSTQEFLPRQNDLHRIELEYKCLEALRGSRNYEGNKNRNTKRVHNTCRWVLRNQKFTDWRDGKSVGLLWVSAGPGFGKSVLTRSLVDERLLGTSEVAICYFFFKEDDENAKRSTDALSVLLYQLLVKYPTLIRHTLSYGKDPKQLLAQSIPTLWNVLEEIVKDPTSPQLVFVIDALDESVDNGKPIIERLVEFYSPNQPSPKSAISKLKFLITSRPYISIQRSFGNLAQNNDSIHLSGDRHIALLREEIKLVMESELHLIEESLRLPKQVITLLKGRLSENENRNYLWLHLVLELIKKSVGATTVTGARKLIAQLPKTAEDAYEAILRKSSNKDEAAKLLHIIVAAVRPLTVAEMRIAIAIDELTQSHKDLDLESISNFETTIRNQCGLFITISDQKIYLVHNTAKDFLLAAKTAPLSTMNSNSGRWKNSIDPSKSHEILSWACIRYLCFSDFKKPENNSQRPDHQVQSSEVAEDEELSSLEEHYADADDDDDDEACNSLDSMTVYDPRHWDDLLLKKRFQKHQFLEYASPHWLSHFQMANPCDVMLQQSLRLCEVRSDLCTNWFEVLPVREGRDLTFFKQSFNHSKVYRGMDLVFCTFMGNTRVTEYLLMLLPHLTADPELKIGKDDVDRIILAALYFAVEEGRSDMIRILLSASETNMSNMILFYETAGEYHEIIDLAGGNELTALRLAVKSGQHHLVPLLLEMGADPNVNGSSTILSLACIKPTEALVKTIKLLLRYGADINKLDFSGISPLYKAIILCLPESIIRLIEDAGGVVTQPWSSGASETNSYWGWEVARLNN
ncbi:uncharacterized protein LY89DRAFT_716235 [Mollisia scopiformis]|uniref:Uncharacterized protein n=1 Tax=Mollisia scopiformis TaxID=149040 RepID=A0A194XHS9_MOLSC|nr:uncharacterized protein LY89DRAFT_716235 [Mollisia scopiformis]KUJ19713.1 hypothetical protein LY89DRAFT_716235 [Mollisia scopiformis]